MSTPALVRDLGEFGFLEDVVLPSLGLKGGIPEDAAVISGDARDLVLTVDRGNRPVLFLLGDEDWQVCGWHLVAATLSDLAAVGASPVAFSSSIVLPVDFRVSHAREFFDGVRLACQRFDVSLAGGNVAEGRTFSGHGFGVGEVPCGSAIRRHGCYPGDSILLIGDGGLFMSGFLMAERLGLQAISERQRTSLRRPAPKLAVMQSLRQLGLVRAASDDSDGVLGAVWNLASASGVAVEISEDRIAWPLHVVAAADLTGLDKRAILFAWGGLQIAAAVRPKDVEAVAKVCRMHQVEMIELGVAERGSPRISWRAGDQKTEMNLVRNEAFSNSVYQESSSASVWEYLRTPLQR